MHGTKVKQDLNWWSYLRKLKQSIQNEYGQGEVCTATVHGTHTEQFDASTINNIQQYLKSPPLTNIDLMAC